MDIESARQRTDERTDERTDGRNETKEHRRGTTKFELEGDTWTPLREARCKGKCSPGQLSRKFFNFDARKGT